MYGVQSLLREILRIYIIVLLMLNIFTICLSLFLELFLRLLSL